MAKNSRKRSTSTVAETFVAELHAMSHEGRGIAEVDGKTVFIDGALKGETVKFIYQNRRPRFDEGLTTEVLKASADRVTPPCLHFKDCGGCSLQHMNQEAELAFKQNTLLEQLQHFGGVAPLDILPPISGLSFGYRRKARLSVKYVLKKEKVLVGFREKKGHFVADIEICEILHPKMGRLIPDLKSLITKLDTFNQIPQIEIAVGDEESALVFRHMRPLSAKDEALFIEFGQMHALHIYLQAAGPESAYRFYPAFGEERLRYRLTDFNLEFKFHPLDFTQVNAEINQQMVAKAVELLDPKPTETVVDFFCGLGNFTLPLARFAAKVIGIEGNRQMVERAIENAKHNHMTNADFIVENLQGELKNFSFSLKNVDKVLLDPPRAGAFEILPLIGKSNVTKVVYVSCNPATLARDLGELVHQYGFCLKSVGIMNMFSKTSHVETIALLERE